MPRFISYAVFTGIFFSVLVMGETSPASSSPSPESTANSAPTPSPIPSPEPSPSPTPSPTPTPSPSPTPSAEASSTAAPSTEPAAQQAPAAGSPVAQPAASENPAPEPTIQDILSKFTDPIAVIRQADTYAAEGKADVAIALLDAAVPKFPQEPALPVAKANILIGLKEYDQAIPICAEAIKKQSDYDWPMILLAKAFFGKEDYATAVQWIDKALTLTDGWDIRAIRAQSLQFLERENDGEEDYNKALQINPKAIFLHEARSWNYLKMGKPEEAEKYLWRALQADPNNPRMHMAMANLARNRRNYDLVFQSLKKADTNNNSAYWPDFFSSTSLKGYSLSQYSVPASLYGSLNYDQTLTAIEGVTRALTFQNINVSNTALLPKPMLTPGFEYKLGATFWKERAPLIHFRLAADNRSSQDDKFIAYSTSEISVEIEHTLATPFGDLTFFPGFQRWSFDYSSYGIASATGSIVSSATNLFGGRFILPMKPGTFQVDGSLFVGVGSWTEQQFRLGAEFSLFQGFTLIGEANMRIGNQFQDPNIFGSRLSLRGGVRLASHETFYVTALVDSISLNEQLSAAQSAAHSFLAPEASFVIYLSPSLMVTARGQRFMEPKYNIYNYTLMEGGLRLLVRLSATRALDEVLVSYNAPIELNAGYRFVSFENYLPGTLGTGVEGVYANLKLFW